MSSSIGENLRLSIFGQSHGPAIGMTLDGLPAGKKIDIEQLCRFLKRRAPGTHPWSSTRMETDDPEILAGLISGVTCGSPLTAVIHNRDARTEDYSSTRVPRPGHADYTAHIKYAGYEDAAGGGHLSGRLTAPLCIAGGICRQLLQAEGINVISRIASIADVSDEGKLVASTGDKPFPAVSDTQAQAMIGRIAAAKDKGNSVGGVIECKITGLPAGLGDPLFGGMENRISAVIFGIPGIKAIGFGAGFEVAQMTGTENNDSFRMEDGRVCTVTNNCGGILGGITDGMPLIFRVAVKPTPSVAVIQKSIDFDRMENADLIVKGRHDPCIVPRVVPCVEAAAAFAVYDAFLGRKREL